MNLESQAVVLEKSNVVKKALAELISTKYKMAEKSSQKEKDDVLDKMGEAIANKGRLPPPEPRRSDFQDEPLLNAPKSEIIRRVSLTSPAPASRPPPALTRPAGKRV